MATAAELYAENAVLGLDVVAQESDTKLRKKGDAVQTYRQLPYEGSGGLTARQLDPDDLMAVLAVPLREASDARYQPVPYTTWPAKATSVSIVGAGNRNPAWLSNDGTRVFCNSVNVLYWSDDEFSTIVTSIDMAAAGAAGSIQTVRETGDGELLLFMGSTTGSVWRTVGYLNGAAGPLVVARID